MTDDQIKRASDVMYEHANGGLYDPLGLARALSDAGLLATPADQTDEQVESIVKVLLEHHLQYDNTGGFRGVLGGWNRTCTCGWHGVDEDATDHSFEHHVAGLLSTPADQDDWLIKFREAQAEVRQVRQVCREVDELRERAEAKVERADREAAKARAVTDYQRTLIAEAQAERDQLRAQVAAVRVKINVLAEAVEAQCFLDSMVCEEHGVDIYDGECSLVHGIRALDTEGNE